MSKSGNSLDLTEFFNNDESNGHRLAEFLQKRRGGVQCQKFLFVDNDPLRLSVEVQLERLPEPVQKDSDKEKPAPKEIQSQPEDVNGVDEKANTVVQPTENAEDAPKILDVGGSANCRESIFKPVSPARNSLPPLSPTRLAAIRKSGGVSPGDRLRRYSLKRLSRLSNGRRTLLKDFESTMTDSAFSPQVCSTPLSQPSNSDKAESLASPTRNVENVAPNESQANNRPQNEGTFSWSVSPAKASQNKDESLRQMMESIVETTLKRVQSKNKEDEEIEKLNQQKTFEKEKDTINSTLRRTYTLEKGQKPGQVVLTPDVVPSPKSNTIDISGFLQRSRVHGSSPSIGSRTPERIQNCAHDSPKSSTSNRCSLIGENVAVNNNTHCSGHDPNGGDNFFATKELTDMDITPQVHQVSRNLTLRSRNIGNSSSKLILTPKGNRNRSQLTVCFDSPHTVYSPEKQLGKRGLKRNRSFVMLNKSKCGGDLSSSTRNVEICRTPSPINERNASYVGINNNKSVVEEELVIPETQDMLSQGRNSIVIETPTDQVPFVVIPVSQNFNNSVQNEYHDEVDDAGNITNVVEMSCHSRVIVAKPKLTQNTSQLLQSPTNDINSNADNLKLTDILTDDEDEPMHTTMSETLKCNSQVPLNLAGGNDRTKRLRKRSSTRQRLQKFTEEVISTETETEPIPLNLNKREANRKRSIKRRQIPLNKAPGAPLNGEEFAKELARMSNYEILDLRKRNSMGRIFAISGRKSLRKKDQALKNQVKLDDEIELELLRRNMQMANDETVDNVEVAVTEKNNEAEDTVQNEAYPPAPQEFCDIFDDHEETSHGRQSSLVDEQSCDRVSFRNRRDSLRKKRGSKPVPEVLKNYLMVSKKINESKKEKRRSMNRSKRSLYTFGLSELDSTICSSSSDKITMSQPCMPRLPYVPSPPRSETEEMPTLRIVSPPPPLSMSLENLQRTEVVETVEQAPTVPSTPPPPPPPLFDADSDKRTNISSQSQPSVGGEEFEFKKPLPPPPKKSKKLVRQNKVESFVSLTQNSESTMSESSENTSEDGSLRRSKRGQVPLKNSTPLFLSLYQKAVDKQIKTWEKRAKKKGRDNSSGNIDSINSSVDSGSNKSTTSHRSRKPLAVVPEKFALEINSYENVPTKGKKKSKNVTAKVTRKAQKGETLECSRISLATPPSLDHFNNVFDHLRNTSHIDDMISEKENRNVPATFKVKKLKVRVARLKITDEMTSKNSAKSVDGTGPGNSISHCEKQQFPSDNTSTVSSTNDTKQSNYELISWLKNVTQTDNSSARNEDIFKEMRISSASNLGFTELQGVEYAFYDTDEKASLGYLRFKPHQIKPKKRAKRFHLHFVTLVGNFRITANDKESIVGPGDLVAIEKSVYYDIENLSDDIGILMVIKK